MKILVACEESQAVTIELRKLGHEAYSCDIQECSGGHPEWHIVADVIPILDGKVSFYTQDESFINIETRWDMIIAFPPCTHLAVSGARHFEKKREDGRQLEAIELFMEILNADCDKIAVENPVNIIGGGYIAKWFPHIISKYPMVYRKKDQIIQPWQFGDKAQKTTCLWLKGLPLLKHTDVVDKGEFVTTGKDNKKYAEFTAWMKDENGKTIGWNDPRTAKLRSKTFPGIAKAMAEQWGGKCETDIQK